MRAVRRDAAIRRKLVGLLLTAFVSISASATAFAQAPIVTNVSPTKGLGGTSVTVTGCNFSGVTAVDFGGSSATFGAPSGTGTETLGVCTATATIVATAPPGSIFGATVDVTVVNGSGTSATSLSDQFTYYGQVPVVTGLSPNAGDASGSVTIAGCNFNNVSAVDFGGVPASAITINNQGLESQGCIPFPGFASGSITVTVPKGPTNGGTVDVTVTTTIATSATSSSDHFTYYAPPTVSAISPNNGAAAGGTAVTITGTNFQSNVNFITVMFGGSPAAKYIVNSDTSITATSPAASIPNTTGTVDIVVSTNNGTSQTSAADKFTYNGTVTTVTAVSPSGGAAAGGNTVTITGTNFTAASAVKFGAVAATVFAVNSATSITATSPAGTGTVDVTVTAPGGTSATSASDQFTYFPAPTVTALAPNSGLAAGGTSVAITGTNFTGVTAVQFGKVAATSFTVNSPTSITATSPAGSGTVDVTVTATGGTSATSSADQFIYAQQPAVTALAPKSGPPAGGTSVAITGINLSGATAVKFGGTAAASFTVNSATSITATSPSGTGTVDVIVTTPGGTSVVSAADRFTFTSGPTVTAISPNNGASSGGTSVTISGVNFTGATAVKFGGTPATTFSVISANSISATSPSGSGTVDVTVTTPIGTSSTSSADQFTYNPAPTVTAVSPNSGLATGGATVNISGTGFTGATAVRFAAAAATSFTVNNATSITATAPAGAGVVDVVVTTPNGTSATGPADQFTYLGAAGTPAVTGLSPNNGPSTGGTSVTITGTNFNSLTVAHVMFGSNNAAPFTINSTTSITVNSPPGTGVVDVTLTGGGGTSATSAADKFTYNAVVAPAPTVTGVTPNSGPLNSGISVTITGTNFTGATAVKFGANAAASFTVNSSSSITATSPTGTGTVDVTVTTPGGTSAASASDHFTYASSPAVTSVSPAAGLPGGGSNVTITGMNLTGATAVKFGATPAASFTVNSANSITATSPPGTGTVDITVTTPGGTSAIGAGDQFTYAGAPTVTSVSPNAGPNTGATSVTVTGTNFVGVTTVKFGGTAATSFSVVSATSITATSPAGTGTVDVTVTTLSGTSAIGAGDHFVYGKATTSMTLSSSPNPSSYGQTVTFTARVTGNSPTGTVTFLDGTTPIGSVPLVAGVATLQIASLSTGSHSITATYPGDANNAPDPVVLVQTVSVSTDSLKLREMQVSAMPIVANLSGQAISGAIDNAVGVGFSDHPQTMTPNGSGFTYYFDADPSPKPQQGNGGHADAGGAPMAYGDHSNLNSDFLALGYDATPVAGGPLATAPPSTAPQTVSLQSAAPNSPSRSAPSRDWLGWIDVRGMDFDNTSVGNDLKGVQVNAIAGLTRRFSDDFLVGVLAGYEHFDFTSQAYNGVLRGDGFTAGAYLGSRLASNLRFQAGAAWSDILVGTTSGSATGNFTGSRLLATGGLTGSYNWQTFALEPSAQVYALWEQENAYTDSLGTQQASHDFKTGRASGGAKVSYPFAFSEMTVTPYLGVYGDYYFSMDNGQTTALTTVPLLQGFAARATFGLATTFAGGGQISAGGEVGGLGNDIRIWTWTMKGSVPF